MERCCSGSEFTACILSEVFLHDFTEIDLGECHRLPRIGRLGFVVDDIDENTHPLVARAMSIDRAAGFPSRFDFDALRAGLHGIVGVTCPQ